MTHNNTPMDQSSIVSEFQAAGRASGLEIPGSIQPGVMIRFQVGSGHNKDGYTILYLNPDGTTGGCFGNWKTGTKESWFSAPAGRTLTRPEKRRLQKQIEEARQAEQKKQKEIQQKAAIEAQIICGRAGSASPDHPYLKNKNITPYGAFHEFEHLIIPVRDIAGNVISIQKIFPDGRKQFLKGGKIKGGFHTIGDMSKSGIISIVKGWATGCTVHKLTATTVVVAFNSGNLMEVARNIRALYPEKTIIIRADNDLETKQKTGKNPGVESAMAAAAKVGGGVQVCPINSDWNDLSCQKGEAAAREALTSTQIIFPQKWEPIIPLDDPEPPRFEKVSFPGIIGNMAEAVSQALEVPFEMSAGLVLSVLATACQGKIIIQLCPGYYEPLNIWVFVGMEPGNRKSSTLAACTKPLSDWEMDKKTEMEWEIKEAQIKRELDESRLKALKSKHGKAKPNELEGIKNEIILLTQNMPEVPIAPRVSCQDITPEYLATLMGIHNENMSILSAEGGIAEIIAGRYSGGTPNLDIFLQSHSGDRVRVDRGSREPVILDEPCLTMGLCPQPDVLNGMASKPGFRGRGLMDRFLYLLPKSPLGYRTLDTRPVSEDVKARYNHLIRQLLDIPQLEGDHQK